jgi:hypothetical protein
VRDLEEGQVPGQPKLVQPSIKGWARA